MNTETPTKTSQQPPPKTKQIQRQHVGKGKRELKARAKTIALSILEGQSATEALITAGYSEGYATHHKESILANPTIHKTFVTILEAAGVTDEKIADKIRGLIDAKETKFFSHQGEVTDSREVEALAIQSNMVQFAAKLKGHVVERSASLNVNVECSPVDLVRWGGKVDKPVDTSGSQPHCESSSMQVVDIKAS
jgi:DNA-binding CsgD family transcriptional regulator